MSGRINRLLSRVASQPTMSAPSTIYAQRGFLISPSPHTWLYEGLLQFKSSTILVLVLDYYTTSSSMGKLLKSLFTAPSFPPFVVNETRSTNTMIMSFRWQVGKYSSSIDNQVPIILSWASTAINMIVCQKR